ncbi:carbohydrate kinase family protein [Galactobacter valiniphilus]|uniref:carbohydrate kinase family protein n=1 Tax=Galactobacter valiniphilus TaxID=2676122 RepID=UPI003736FF0F
MFLVMGEALVDVISGGIEPPTTHVGGSPLNVAVGLARLEVPVTLVTRYGRDAYGTLVHETLQRNGVAELLGADEHPTATAHGILDPAGSADYEFDTVQWSLEGFTGVLAQRALEDAEALHVGSLGAALEPGASTVRRAVQEARPHATISYDPNVRPRLTPDRAAARTRVEGFIALADVVRASDSDLAWLYPDRDPIETARSWLAAGPSVVILTMGAGGAHGFARNGDVHVAAIEADVEDTVGAGDSSMAAVLMGLSERGYVGPGRREALREISAEELRTIMELAAKASSITVSRAGANPPTRAELGA